MNENSQVIVLKDHQPSSDASVIEAVRTIAKKYPLIAVFVSITLGLGVPTSFGFLGASQGAASAITDKLSNHGEKLVDHETRITTAERDITGLQAASGRHGEVLQKIEIHMAVQAEQTSQIRQAIEDLKK